MIQQLTGKQCRFLRGLGHHLQPVIMVGKDGISKTVITAAEEALEQHELIKIRVQDGCLIDRKEVAAAVAEKCCAAIAQILGNTILLYRASEEQLITLPKSNKP